MKIILQILFLLLNWVTTFANATPPAQKITISDYSISFPTTENQKQESEVKIGIQNFARSGISEKSHPLNATSRENYVLEEARARMSGEVVSGAGKAGLLTKFKDFANVKTWINTLDDVADASLLSKLDNLEASYFTKLDADLVHATYGTEIKAPRSPKCSQ